MHAQCKCRKMAVLAYRCTKRNSYLSSLLRPPQGGRCPGKLEQTRGPGPAASPGDSLPRARSSSPRAVGSGARRRRTRRSAESNKWSGYPITSLSTSVRLQDMARGNGQHVTVGQLEELLLLLLKSSQLLHDHYGIWMHVPAGKREQFRYIYVYKKERCRGFLLKLCEEKTAKRRSEAAAAALANKYKVPSFKSPFLTSQDRDSLLPDRHSPSVLCEPGGEEELRPGLLVTYDGPSSRLLSVSSHADCTQEMDGVQKLSQD